MRVKLLLLALAAPLPSLSAVAGETAAAEAETPARQCHLAYRQENLPYILEHCPEEAWALARAQCERNSDSVSSRYAEFCHRFYTGTAPTYGN
ncbi:MAG: hypothetical protein PHX10_06365 [Gallionellaceae bacterium]|nr:hypothetical protein [Gallionellaceae bacterium]